MARRATRVLASEVRIVPATKRNYPDFARVWLRAVQQDLRDQRREWAVGVVAGAPGPAPNVRGP